MLSSPETNQTQKGCPFDWGSLGVSLTLEDALAPWMHSGKRQGECSHGFHQLGWDRWGIIRQGGFDKKKCSNWQLAAANSTWPMPCSAAFVLPLWVGMPECRWSLGAVRCFPSTNSLLVTSVKSNCFNTKSTFWGLNQYDYHEIPICAGSILIVAGEITIFAACQVKVPLVAGETTIFTMTSPRNSSPASGTRRQPKLGRARSHFGDVANTANIMWILCVYPLVMSK